MRFLVGKLYRDKEVGIPREAYVNTHDGRVYVKRPDERGEGRRIVIGKATSPSTMAPNETFRALFPAAWDALCGKDEPTRLVAEVGTYALALAVGTKSGAYPITQTAYGNEVGNAFMDWCMFSLLEGSDSNSLFCERMADEVLFSPTARSDSWYYDTFATLTEDQHLSFSNTWLERCRGLGTAKVWLFVSGPYNDENTVYYIEAIDAKDARPITFFVYPVVDCKAIQEAIAHLRVSDIDVAGVVLGSGFCTPEAVRDLNRLSIDYEITMPRDTLGYKDALTQYAEDLRWRIENLVDEGDTFGIATEGRVWDGCDDRAHINLYFSGIAASTQSVTLIKKVKEEMKEARSTLDAGAQPTIDESLRKFFHVEADEEGEVVSVDYDHEAFTKALAEEGYFALVTSRDMGAREALEAYRLAGSSKSASQIANSFEGPDAARAQSTESIHSRLAVGFLCNLLRFEIQSACTALGLDFDEAIYEVDNIWLLRTAPGIYTPAQSYTQDQLALLKEFGIDETGIAFIARDYSQRLLNPNPNHRHKLPERAPMHRRGRGRVKGSKSKRTIEREAEIERAKAEGTYVEPTKRKPGRPKGSKDTKPRKTRSDLGIKRGPRDKGASRPEA